MYRDLCRLDQQRLLRRPVAADRVRHHPARRREAERAGHRTPVPGTAHGASPDGRGRIDQSDAASRCSPDPGRLAEGQSAENNELIYFVCIGAASMPTPVSCPNSAASLARSVSGNGGLSSEATFVRRCAGSPVPNSTTSTPGSWRAKRYAASVILAAPLS